MNLWFNGGAGDFLQIERFWTQEERQALDTIYWDALCQSFLQPFLEASRAYQHCEHITLEGLPPDWLRKCSLIRHLSVLHRRQFFGSSFLRETLAELPKGLPSEFVVIHATTPKNTPSARQFRDLGGSEWSAILSTLEAWGLPGLVLNSVDEGDTPDDPRLINLSGKTTFAESVEITKRASGYVGIDSCLAFLAAEFLPARRLTIRTRNPFVVEQARNFYAPHLTFPFLVDTIGGPAYPPNPPPGDQVIVELNRAQMIGRRFHDAFDFIEMSPEVAGRFVDRGFGRIVEHLD